MCFVKDLGKRVAAEDDGSCTSTSSQGCSGNRVSPVGRWNGRIKGQSLATLALATGRVVMLGAPFYSFRSCFAAHLRCN
jgi:hypothetical protein